MLKKGLRYSLLVEVGNKKKHIFGMSKDNVAFIVHSRIINDSWRVFSKNKENKRSQLEISLMIPNYVIEYSTLRSMKTKPKKSYKDPEHTEN